MLANPAATAFCPLLAFGGKHARGLFLLYEPSQPFRVSGSRWIWFQSRAIGSVQSNGASTRIHERIDASLGKADGGRELTDSASSILRVAPDPRNKNRKE